MIAKNSFKKAGFGREYPRGRRQQGGFAMLFSLFFLAVASTMVVAGLGEVTRNQRVSQRATDRVQLTVLAESIFEMTSKAFEDFVKTESQQPQYFADYTICKGVRSGLGCSTTEVFHDYIKTKFMDTHALNDETLVQVVDFKIMLTDWPGKNLATPLDPQDTDAWRRYTATVRLKKKGSGARLTLSHNFKLATYSIYDFGVFYNVDLEIAFGPSATLEGPIFSNKDIYLMTDSGSTLTLKQSTLDKRILESAGNTYFYFKRAWGYNYLRDAGFDPATTNPDPVVEFDFKGQVHPDIKALYKKMVDEAGAVDHKKRDELYGDNIERQYGRDKISEYDGYAGLSWNYGLPIFYYFRNGAKRDWFRRLGVPQFKFLGADNTSTTVALPENVMQAHYISYPGWDNDADPVAVYTEYSDYKAAGLNVNLSTNFDFAANQYSPSTTLGKPRKTDAWANYAKSTLKGWILDDPRLKKSLPLPDKLADYPRLMIEPIQDASSELWDKYPSLTADEKNKILPRLIRNQANIYINCTSAVCVPTSIYGLAVTVEDFSDNRLAGKVGVLGSADKVKTAVLDFSAFDFPFRNDDNQPEPIVYVQTCAMNSVENCNGKIRAVKIKGAARAWVSGMNGGHRKGYTFATNGRLWVEGDFNTQNSSGFAYTVLDRKPINPEEVVSVALFSDSFGLLFPTGASTLSLNAAVLTGTLNSSLEARDCSSMTTVGGADGRAYTLPNSNCRQRDQEWGWADSRLSQDSDLFMRIRSEPVHDPGPTGGWPAISAWDWDVSDRTVHHDRLDDINKPLGNLMSKVTGAMALPGFYFHVLVATGYFYPVATGPGFCWDGFHLNYRQILTSGESAVGATPTFSPFGICWNGASGTQYDYNNPLRWALTGQNDNLVRDGYWRSMCYTGGWWGDRPCDGGTSASHYFFDDSSLDPAHEMFVERKPSVAMDAARIEPSTTNVAVAPTTGLYHATLQDYAIASGAPSGAANFKLYYDDSVKRIVACDGADYYKIKTSPTLPLVLTRDASKSCTGLIPYIAARSKIHNGNPDMTFYPLYAIGSHQLYADLACVGATSASPLPCGGSNPFYRETTWSFGSAGLPDDVGKPDNYYTLGTGRYYLVTPPRANVDVNREVALTDVFFWKGDHGENFQESPTDVCGLSVVFRMYNAAGTSKGETKLPGNICLGSGSGTKLNFYFAKPQNRLYTDASIFYYHGRYWPLYVPRYSGGIENLINLQQDLSGKTLTTFGSFASMWESEELRKKDGTKAYYSDQIYKAPLRNWYFNRELAKNPPPGSPSLYGVERSSIKEESQKEENQG